MKSTFFAALSLITFFAAIPLCKANEEPEQPGKISMGDWQKIMSRVRNYDEDALSELMQVVNTRKCPGTTDELVAMLKIAAGMGEKRAQYLLAACYREGKGVRENGKSANAWEIIYNHY